MGGGSGLWSVCWLGCSGLVCMLVELVMDVWLVSLSRYACCLGCSGLVCMLPGLGRFCLVW
jgi:hypothetical protein